MKLSLRFGGLTTLVAHLLTSRTLGRNPRVLQEKTLCPLSLFFSLLFFSFLMQRVYLTPPFLFEIRCRTPHLLISFKIVQDTSLQRERIKLGGCSLEFKSNLNSNANQPILIHSGREKRGGMDPLCIESLHEKLFLM